MIHQIHILRPPLARVFKQPPAARKRTTPPREQLRLGSEQRHLCLGTPVQEDFGEDTHKHRDWACQKQAKMQDTMDEILDAQEFWEDI